jgi:hypothetical protein
MLGSCEIAFMVDFVVNAFTVRRGEHRRGAQSLRLPSFIPMLKNAM